MIELYAWGWRMIWGIWYLLHMKEITTCSLEHERECL